MTDDVLIHGDCLDVLPTLDALSIGAVVTDPPYGFNYSSGRTPNCSWYDRPIKGDDSTYLRDAVLAWAEDRGLPWACFGSWKATVPDMTRGVLIWDKGPAFGMGDLSFPWKPSWEMIFVGGKGWYGSRDEGVLRGPCVVSWESKGRSHPNQKPVWLLASLLRKIPIGRAVLDPFMGIGSTGVACAQTGHPFVGIEIEDRYYNTARQRIHKATMDGPLFISQSSMFDALGDA